MAVVSDLEQLQTTILNKDFNGSRTSIGGILEQLFQSMHGRHDDFTRCNLVDDILVKGLYESQCRCLNTVPRFLP